MQMSLILEFEPLLLHRRASEKWITISIISAILAPIKEERARHQKDVPVLTQELTDILP